MVESILVGLGILIVVLFCMDVRRRALSQASALQTERDSIASLTNSTAVMSAFSDGGSTVVLLAASENSRLFFYRRIDKGLLVSHYTVPITSLTHIILQINGEKRDFTCESSHFTAQMRATDIARQAKQGMTAEDLKKIKHIRLTVFFRSEEGRNESISVTMHKPTQRGGLDALLKVFENAVWWQQYLSQLSQRSSESDTLTFQDAE